MTTSTLANTSVANPSGLKRAAHWLTPLTYVVALLLLALGTYLRLHNLGLAFDRDGYDEGVYWQSIRAMSAGHALYSQIFYSQPPFFLLSVFPFYMHFGQTLWAARLGIAIVSLTGFVGAFLLGRTLAGRIGAICAMLFLVVDPLFLAQSQTLQAEAPSAALSFLAVGLAYAWWLTPTGLAGSLYAIFCGIALVLSICSKLLGVAAIVPIAIIMVMQLWQVYRVKTTPRETKRAVIRSILLAFLAFVLMILALFLPFRGVFPQLWQGMVTFHNDASHLYKTAQAQNFVIMHGLLTSVMAVTALLGSILGLLRKDWRVFPLIAWLLATIVMLWMQIPLFHHHLVALIPPLIGLAVINVDLKQWQKSPKITFLKLFSLLGIALVISAISLNAFSVKTYYADKRTASHGGLNKQIAAVAADVSRVTRPDQLVITDDQFIAGVANRDTPPSLVDTSLVRAETGYVTLQQLIQQAQNPRVEAVLFYTGRFSAQKLAPFHKWVTEHFHLAKNYGSWRELWVKN